MALCGFIHLHGTEQSTDVYEHSDVGFWRGGKHYLEVNQQTSDYSGISATDCNLMLQFVGCSGWWFEVLFWGSGLMDDYIPRG